MTGEEEKVSLKTLANGAAIEAFDHELQRVLDNIMDPNTKADIARGITLHVRIKPTADRELGDVEISCKPNLAGPKPFSTRLYIGMKGTKAMAVEHDPDQTSLFKQDEPTPLRAVGGDEEKK